MYDCHSDDCHFNTSFWGCAYSGANRLSPCPPYWAFLGGRHLTVCTCPTLSAATVTLLSRPPLSPCVLSSLSLAWQHSAQSQSHWPCTFYLSCTLPEAEAILRWSWSHQLCLGSGYFAVSSCVLSTGFFYHFWPELPLFSFSGERD